MKYHADMQAVDGRYVYLESSYLTGLMMNKNAMQFIGEFCVNLSQMDWWNGCLEFREINQCQIMLNGRLASNEFDFGSPEIFSVDKGVLLKISYGEFQLSGPNITTELTLTEPCERSDG